MKIKNYVDEKESESFEITKDEQTEIEKLFGDKIETIEIRANTATMKIAVYINEVEMPEYKRVKKFIEALLIAMA